MRIESGYAHRDAGAVPARTPAAGRAQDAPFGVLLARLLVKAMRSTLNDGPLAGGSGARLFGQVMEEALSDAVASRILRRGTTP